MMEYSRDLLKESVSWFGSELSPTVHVLKLGPQNNVQKWGTFGEVIGS
jgi:hypothetical protein